MRPRGRPRETPRASRVLGHVPRIAPSLPHASQRTRTVGASIRDRSGRWPLLASRAMLPRELVEEVLRAARRRGGSFSELFVEERTSTSISLDDGKVEELTSGLDRGAGVRVALGTSYGYAYSNRLDRDSLLQAAEAASAALLEGEPGSIVDLTAREGPGVNRTDRPGGSAPGGRQGGLAAGARRRRARPESRGRPGDRDVRRFPPATPHRHVGRPLGRGGASADPAGQPGRRRPRRHDPDRVLRPRRLRRSRALRSLQRCRDRREGGPAGRDDARFDPRAGRRDGRGPRARDGRRALPRSRRPSARSRRRRQGGERLPRVSSGPKCASEVVNGVDDATIPNGWGSFDFDDEGEPSSRTVLFEDGVLQGYLYDRLRADKDGVAVHRQRAARVLRQPADPADDEHEHPRRTRSGPRRSSRARRRVSSSRRSAAGRSTRRAATSCSGAPRRS